MLRFGPEASISIAGLLISGIGLWASGIAAEILGDDDPSSVVIDEVAGVLLSLALIPHAGFLAWAIAFLLFRLLDIWKPWLIDRAQYLEPKGLGIMADDILAGLVTGLVVKGLVTLIPSLG